MACRLRYMVRQVGVLPVGVHLEGRTQAICPWSIMRRIKTIFWWCYMHSEAPLSYADALQAMPDDEQVLEWGRQAAKAYETGEDVARWGTGVIWSELHMCGSKATGWF